MGHFYRIFFLSFTCSLISLTVDSQTITNSYTYTYDTIFNTQNGTQNFSYTGAMQTFNASPGTYTLEVWGGQGGSCSSYSGGTGGYAVGTLTLTQSEILYVYVGGAGQQVASNTGIGLGGFNGGGQGTCWSNSTNGGGGGGGSDIRIGSQSLYARVIVAGGGGGATGNSSCIGGSGGGTYGNIGGGSYNSAHTAAGQTNYGSGGYNNGSFGQGGSSTDINNNGWTGGGGGGWYGGSAGSVHGSGDGGSGYVYTSTTASNYPQGCLLNSNYYLIGTSMSSGANSGDGKAKITYTSKVLDHVEVDHIYVTTTITDFVCKNGVYNKYGFTVNGSDLSSGVHTYTNHFSYGNTDSTVILNITIKPDVTAYEEIEAPYSYTWPANGETYTTSGIYTHTLVSQEGCDSSIILALTIYDPSGIDDKDARTTEFLITPNPSNDYIDITNDTHSDIEIQLYNSFGQKILSKKLTGKVTRILLTNYPSGTYFISFSDNGKVIKTTKFIKSR